MELAYAIEEEPLGTGGAIWNAFQFCKDETVMVLNGDSLFEVNLNELYRKKLEKEADMVLSLKPMTDFDRYGVVELDSEGRILEFKEKTYQASGLINGGVYCFDIPWAHQLGLTGKFSFEKDVMEQFVHQHKFFGYISEAYFIDIGIPADYQTAQTTFKEKQAWLN